MRKITSVFLVICGLGFLQIAVNTFSDPLSSLRGVDLAINTVTAKNELRANYGGLQLGIAVLLFAGAGIQRFSRYALVVQSLLVGGLVIGRLVSIAIDGLPSDFMIHLLALESAVLTASLILLVKAKSKGIYSHA